MNSQDMTPDDVIDLAYELISFGAGGNPAWTEFRALFTEPSVLALRVFPEDSSITVMDLDGYVLHQMRDGLSDEGYSETPGQRTSTVIGDAAIVNQEFFMHYRDREPVRAFDGFSLVRIDGIWKIASIISDMITNESRFTSG